MAHTNPFFVTVGTKTRLINSANAASAVTFALMDQGVSVKAASGRALSAFLVGGGEMEQDDGKRPDPDAHPLTPFKTSDLDPGVQDMVREELRDEPLVREVVEEVDHAVKHAGDAEKLHSGHAEEIAVDGLGRAARKPATKAVE